MIACDPAVRANKDLGFCQVSLPIADRVRDLIGRLTLQEKINLLGDKARAVERLGVKKYDWWNEALHGVSDFGVGVKFGGDFPGATSFPEVIVTAATFNASLWEEIGKVVSDEARAMYNGGRAGLTFWSPNVNILRDPRWGRGQETAGEDPFVVSKFGVRYVNGLQGDLFADHLKVAACCKHFTAYDLDNWNGINRYIFNARVSKQDLEDSYNVPFKACVVEGKAASVMCSYNQVNGIPSCADPALNQTIRTQWQLNGYIVSDCDSVGVFYKKQHYTKTPEEAVARTLKAGLDLNCGHFLEEHAESAVQAGRITEKDIDAALTNTLSVQMRLGLFDGLQQPYSHLGPKDVCTPYHQELALKAAQQGFVLLKNAGRALPLSTNRHRSVAVIGPNSNATVTMIGNYHGCACQYISPLQGISKYTKIIHHLGCENTACKYDKQFEGAEYVSKQADATVMVMGLDQSVEEEERDRTSLLLPGLQRELVLRVANASKGPVILVIMSGGPVDVTFAKNDPNIAAILWVGYPGQAGGQALADILFGEHNPEGKLPMTWYPEEYIAHLPMTIMDLRPDPATGYPGRTYRFYKGPVVYGFGWGLSYTKFSQKLSLAPASILVTLNKGVKAIKTTTPMKKSLKVSHVDCDSLNFELYIDVKNVGNMDGSHTVMVFSTPPLQKYHWAPNKELVGFEKVHVLAGAEKRVRIDIDVCKSLSVVDQFGIRRIPLGEHILQIGDDLYHSLTLQAAFQGISTY